MTTQIETTYYIELKRLASKFAAERASKFIPTSQTKVYRSTYEVYMTIGLYLYLKCGAGSIDLTDYNFNRIHSSIFKSFSCKLYHKILDDLEKNQIIRRNNHYNYIQNRNGVEQQIFSKSFLFSHSIQRRIRQVRHKMKYKTTEVELPRKLEKLVVECEKVAASRKLNTNLVQETRTDVIDKHSCPVDRLNYYTDLNFSEKSLKEFCEDDEWKEIYLRKTLRRLKDDAVWKFSRWYHAFHRLSKECREKVLRFEGEHIKEIFDVSGSDMHMLAKHLENEDIPVGELMRFQKDVINDFRKLFGARKSDGKCTSRVKTAFKVYFNSNKSFYRHIKQGSICSRIDEWFKMHYPTIRDYIANKEDLWKDVMESEFDVVSKKMFKELSRRGIKSLTCHDAIYVKESINVPDIKDIFYQCLDLAAYWQIQLACI